MLLHSGALLNIKIMTSMPGRAVDRSLHAQYGLMANALTCLFHSEAGDSITATVQNQPSHHLLSGPVARWPGGPVARWPSGFFALSLITYEL
jgi:hypothetical protein